MVFLSTISLLSDISLSLSLSFSLQLNPSELDLCEDLSELQSVNECGALHTLTSRAKASLPLTQAGPNLLNFWPPLNQHGKVSVRARTHTHTLISCSSIGTR